MAINIAIDGPAGAGKSTIAKAVARELKFIYVDTGAMYRAMALYLIRQGISPREKEKMEEACRKAEISILYDNGSQQVILNGENVTPYLRQEAVGNMASVSSANPVIREKLVELQRTLASRENVVMDGRDIGTCVLPDADVKIYLTASVSTRAARRCKELEERGIPCSLKEIEEDIKERDRRDMEREISPLRQAEDAYLVDSSDMTIQEVKVARTAGFCFGVKRAVEKAYEVAAEKQGPVYTYGPIIHNEEVVSDLEKLGVRVLETEDELRGLKKGTVIIRSHGVPEYIYKLLQEKGLECIDVTCPFVLKIHRIVERESKAGRHIVIIGNPDHPEVAGIQGWCHGPSTVISTKEEARDFLSEEHEKVCIVSQTTFNYNNFQEIVEILNEKRYDRLVLNTICNATQDRQREAEEIAKQVDAMIVVGGRHSSNTQKLYEICKKECRNTYYIQTLADLDSERFRSVQCIGITAGASTPNKIIEEVSKHVRIKF